MTNTLQIPKFLKNLFLISIIFIYLPDVSIDFSWINPNLAVNEHAGLNNLRFLFAVATIICSFFVPATQVRYLKIFHKLKIRYIALPIFCNIISFFNGVYLIGSLSFQEILKNFCVSSYRNVALLISLLPLVFFDDIDELKQFINNLLKILSILFFFMFIVEYICHFTYNQFFVMIYDLFHTRKYNTISESAILLGESISFLPRLSFYAAEPSFSSCLLYTLWPLALYCYLEDKANKNRLWILISFIIYLILTLSTTIFLIIPLQILTLLILSYCFKIKEMNNINKGLIFLLTIMFFSLSFKTQFITSNLEKIKFFFNNDISAGTNLSAVLRSAGIVSSLNIFKLSPFLGIGAGNLLYHSEVVLDQTLEFIGDPRIMQAYLLEIYEEKLLAGLSSWPLRILVETGIVGLSMYLIYFFTSIKSIFKNTDKAFFMTFLVGSLVVLSSQGGDESLYFLIGLGNAYSYLKHINKNNTNYGKI